METMMTIFGYIASWVVLLIGCGFILTALSPNKMDASSKSAYIGFGSLLIGLSFGFWGLGYLIGLQHVDSTRRADVEALGGWLEIITFGLGFLVFVVAMGVAITHRYRDNR